jgi:hypothetical protein
MRECKIDLQFYCKVCGKPMCGNVFAHDEHTNTFMIVPCKWCKQDAEKEGYNKRMHEENQC